MKPIRSLLPPILCAAALLFSSTHPARAFVVGDVNADGLVTILDTEIVLQTVAGLTTLTPDQRELADANDDGVVDLKDVILLLQTAVGLIPPLSVTVPDALTLKAGGPSVQFTIGAVGGPVTPSTILAPIPSGASFVASSGTFSWQAAEGQQGDYVLNLTVRSGSLGVTRVIPLHVLPPDAPISTTLGCMDPGYGDEPVTLLFDRPIDPSKFRTQTQTSDPLQATVLFYNVVTIRPNDPIDHVVPANSVTPTFSADHRSVVLDHDGGWAASDTSVSQTVIRILGRNDAPVGGFPLTDENGDTLANSTFLILPQLLTLAPPSVFNMTLTPPDPNDPGFTAVDPKVAIGIYFSMRVDLNTFSVSLRVRGSGSDPSAWPVVPVNVGWDACQLVATVTPAAPLAPNTDYWFQVTKSLSQRGLQPIYWYGGTDGGFAFHTKG